MATTTGTFILQTVRRHVPSIKFPNRIRKKEVSPVEASETSPMISSTLSAISRKIPSASSSRPAKVPPSRTVSNLDDLKSYQSLPARYRRRPLTQEEMDYIERGGPE